MHVFFIQILCYFLIVKCAVVRFTHEASYCSGWWVKPHNAKLNHACVHLTDALTQSDLHGIYGAFHHRMFPGIRLYLAHLCLCISQKRSCGLLGICSMRAGDDDGRTPASSAWCQQETGGDLAGRAACNRRLLAMLVWGRHPGARVEEDGDTSAKTNNHLTSLHDTPN